MRHFDTFTYPNLSYHKNKICIICDLSGTLIDIKDHPIMSVYYLNKYSIIESVHSFLSCVKNTVDRIFVLDSNKINSSKVIIKWLEEKTCLDRYKITYYNNIFSLSEKEFKRKLTLKIKEQYDIWFALDDNEECSKMYAEEKIISLNLMNE